MKTKHLLLGVWLMLIGFTLPIFAASTPTANDGKWYYVKSQRFEGGTGPWWTFNATTNVTVPGALTKTDAQQFTLVAIGETGKVTIKEKETNLLLTAAGSGVFDPTGAAAGWTITLNTVNGVLGTAFPGENNGLHQHEGGHAWVMKSGWYDLADNCTFFFYEATADLDLALAIDAAVTLKNSTSVGTTVGTTPQAAHNNFQAAIETAKLTLGSTDETAITDAISVLSTAQDTFTGAVKPAYISATPAVNDGKWYYIKSQRFEGGTGPWLTFNDTRNTMVPGALTKTDAQKFSLVQVGTTDKVTIKEFGGKLFSATNGVFDLVGPTTGWSIITNDVAGVTGYAFPGEKGGLHQGNHGWSWEVRANGWFALWDFCTFFFYEATSDIELQFAIETAVVNKNSTAIGNTDGEAPVTAHNNFQAAIETAKLTLGSADETAITNAINALTAAQTTFNETKTPIVESSTAVAPVWYLIKNTNRGGKGATLSTNIWNEKLVCNSVANTVSADGTSTGAAAPALKHLFRFEAQENGDYQIVNAALPDGEVLQDIAGGGGNSRRSIKYGTRTTPATTWKLNFIGTNAGVDELEFVSSGAGVGMGSVFYADDNLNLVSGTGGTGTASAWYVEKYTGSVDVLFQAQYDAYKALYDAIVDVDGNAVYPYLVGLNPGQYAQAKFDELKVAFANIVAEKDANGVSSSVLFQKYMDLTVAITAFKATKVQSTVLYGGIINPTKSYTLRLVQPGSANDGFYLTNPRTDAVNGKDAEGSTSQRPSATFSSLIDPSTTVWKIIEAKLPGQHIITSVRRGVVAGAAPYLSRYEYIDEKGFVRDASSFKDDSDWRTKTLYQNTLVYDAGTTLLIVYFNANKGAVKGYLSCGTAADAKLSTNTTDWATFKLEEYLGTSVNHAAVSDISVKALNRRIVVNGTNAIAQAYTVTGSQVDMSKELNPGIYIVKVDNQTFKVNVR